MERLGELLLRIKQFNEEREWEQFHTPSNLAKSISIEANELLECFQWNDTEFNMDDVLEELADVTNYCLQMAQVLDVDIIDIINRKMDDTEKKYPVGKARGVSTKYDKLQEKGDWMAKYSIVELSINKGNLIGIDNLNNNEKTALELKEK